MGEHKRVALAYPAGIPHIQRITAGVAAYAREHGGWALLVNPELGGLQFRSLGRWDGGGVIGSIRTSAEARRARSLSIPVVNISGSLREPGVATVTVDNVATGRLAAEHLIGCGFRRLGFHGVGGMHYSALRQEGFTAAVRDAGGECSVFNTSQAWPGGPRGAVDTWLASLTPPVGIFAINDYRAGMILDACRRVGLRVPDDVGIVGMNNDEVTCRLTSPTLSSIPRSGERVGWEAAALLDRMMGGEPPQEPWILVPPEPVIQRESTRVTAVEDERLAAAVRFARDHVGDPPDVAALARAAGVSRRWLEKAFGRELACTPREYQARLRIEHAKRLLSGDPPPKLSQVADACGLNDVRRLNALFDQAGEPRPREFRRRRGQAPMQ